MLSEDLENHIKLLKAARLAQFDACKTLYAALTEYQNVIIKNCILGQDLSELFTMKDAIRAYIRQPVNNDSIRSFDENFSTKVKKLESLHQNFSFGASLKKLITSIENIQKDVLAKSRELLTIKETAYKYSNLKFNRKLVKLKNLMDSVQNDFRSDFAVLRQNIDEIEKMDEDIDNSGNYYNLTIKFKNELEQFLRRSDLFENYYSNSMNSLLQVLNETHEVLKTVTETSPARPKLDTPEHHLKGLIEEKAAAYKQQKNAYKELNLELDIFLSFIRDKNLIHHPILYELVEYINAMKMRERSQHRDNIIINFANKLDETSDELRQSIPSLYDDPFFQQILSQVDIKLKNLVENSSARVKSVISGDALILRSWGNGGIGSRYSNGNTQRKETIPQHVELENPTHNRPR